MSTATVPEIKLTIDGVEITVPEGTTIFDAARMNGIAIPTLCHQQNETPVGVCRVCVVDVGARVYAASCIRAAENGMKVTTNSDAVHKARNTVVELLMADHPSPCKRQQHSGDCELEALAAGANITRPRFAKRPVQKGEDDSSLSIFVDHDACILCDRCIRGCTEIRHNYVLARQGKGYWAGISFDDAEPMGASTCVSCGECMVSCPTGALTNKRTVGQHLEVGDIVDPEELLRMPVFSGVSGTFLDLNKGAIVRRHYKAGDIVCREGEYGSTAFYILEGTAEIGIRAPIAHVATEDAAQGWFSRLRSKLVGRNEHTRIEEVHKSFISVDGPVDLPYDNPVAELGPGDLFGEMACMNFYPRSATVRAKTDMVCLEMLRNVLDILQKNKTFKAQLDRRYRDSAMMTHLRSIPMLSALTPDFLNHLKERVELIRYAPGQVIFRQGDRADAFYLVRVGFVKVTEEHPGGELVLAYLPRGSYFGEMGLLNNGVRTATCTALDHVEVVRISEEDFREMIDRFPQVRTGLEQIASTHAEQNRQRLVQVREVPVDDFLNQGLMEAQSLLVLDLHRCTRCDQCVKACADAHDGITRLIRDGLRFDHYLVATSCRSCRDPLCMVGCPVGSIRRRNSLEIIIEDWCVGCGLCANNCPYGNITLHPFSLDGHSLDDAHGTGMQAQMRRKATSCDLCHDHPEPSCVYACPHDAAHRVDPRTFFASVLGESQTTAPSGDRGGWAAPSSQAATSAWSHPGAIETHE